MGQSLFKKHSEFQKFGEILYCGMIRFSKYKSYLKKKENTGQNCFKKLARF